MDKKFQKLKLEYNASFSIMITLLIILYSLFMASLNSKDDISKIVLSGVIFVLAIGFIFCMRMLINQYKKLNNYLTE